MNFSLDNNVNKLVLLLVVGVVLLLIIHMYKKKLGEQVSVLLSVVVLVVCGYFGYVLLNSPDENFNNPNESFSPIYENFEDNEHKHKEHFDGHNLLEHTGNMEQFLEHEKHQEHFENSESNPTPKPTPKPTTKPTAASPNNSNNAGNNEMNSEDLFPHLDDSNSKWCKVVPNNNGQVECKSLLNAGHHIGVNTTGCSMRNSNRGLRSEPPNPQVQVSPWLQTTICPDPFRKPLDGCD